MIHSTAQVDSKSIGTGTNICIRDSLSDAEIGKDCNICSHCLIENNVKIGDRVT